MPHLQNVTRPVFVASQDPYAEWLAEAAADLRGAEGDVVETERRLDQWISLGRNALGDDLNLHALFAAIRLPCVPSGVAADARLRRRKKLSDAAYGAVLRAELWQANVLYLCDAGDGHLFTRLHGRTLAILEDAGWRGTVIDAARWAVSIYIAEQGLTPDLDAPVPTMEAVQRRAFRALNRDIAAYQAVVGENRG
ncbi:MAG: hypothetical protein AAGK37_14775 [Pseudomonadota bacterium]